MMCVGIKRLNESSWVVERWLKVEEVQGDCRAGWISSSRDRVQGAFCCDSYVFVCCRDDVYPIKKRGLTIGDLYVPDRRDPPC
jgi:hypothetical protein